MDVCTVHEVGAASMVVSVSGYTQPLQRLLPVTTCMCAVMLQSATTIADVDAPPTRVDAAANSRPGLLGRIFGL